MTTDENILKEMLERATNSARDTIDNLSVEIFCKLVQSNTNLVTKAHELIVKKLQSNNTTEAIKAIGLLEVCMSNGGLEFQKKTARFTFLNELIALVLDRHAGTTAPDETKKRIMDCLMLWTVQHKDKPKIQDAYDNLKKQVNFSHGPSAANSKPSCLSAPVQRSSFLRKDDDDEVAKLVKQGGEENFKKANLLIQHRFNEEARHTELMCDLKSELKQIKSAMEVLEEMLNSYSAEITEEDSRELMRYLYDVCKHNNQQMTRWPDILSDKEPEFLEDALSTKDLLMVVLQRYKELFESEMPSEVLNSNIEESTNNTACTNDTPNRDLLSEPLDDTIITSMQVPKATLTNSPAKTSNNTSLDELREIFGSIDDNIESDTKLYHPLDLIDNLDLLKPISVFESATKTTTATDAAVITNSKETKKGFKELTEIDKLSEEIFKQSLKEEQRVSLFKKEKESKLTLNDMAKDQLQTSVALASKVNNSNQVANTLKSKLEPNPVEATLEPLAAELEQLQESDMEKESLNTSQIQEKQDTSKDLTILKSLAEISIDLDFVTPLEKGQRVLLDDDDIQVTLNFTADRPSQHVSVIVLAVTNKSKYPINEFQFEASVKKPCKVRLLQATDVAMAANKPFRPSAPINQVVLLLNPTEKPVDVNCIVGYKIADDPDPIKELIVAKDIPYVE